MRLLPLVAGLLSVLMFSIPTEAQPSREEMIATLKKAADFYIENCSKHGGYVWRYSNDLTLSEGEAETPADVIWVQPHGTPTIGSSLLRVYEVTGDRKYLDEALRTGEALVSGQLHSGGWYYSITFDPEERKKWGYRENVGFRTSSSRKNKTNITTLDDDTTPAAVRFLVELDAALNFRNAEIHDAARFALDALLLAQHPNGGWAQNWDRHPRNPVWPKYPVLAASYPTEWSRVWLNDWTGKYFLNDNVCGNMIDTMLLASKYYQDSRYLESAKKTGDFLLLARMPEPQPAWAQQYNEQMYPVWDRKFEPPAIASDETQETLESLMTLYEWTGDERYLEPVPGALAWLKKSLLDDGQLARFYELKTNQPLYFVVVDGKYNLTSSDADLPTHYGFKIASQIEKLERMYELVQKARKPGQRVRRPSAGRLNEIVSSLDKRGAWTEPGPMKGYRKASREAVITSEMFYKNVRDLCDGLQNSPR